MNFLKFSTKKASFRSLFVVHALLIYAVLPVSGTLPCLRGRPAKALSKIQFGIRRKSLATMGICHGITRQLLTLLMVAPVMKTSGFKVFALTRR